MEISLGNERVFHLQPRFSLEQARAQVEEKKISLVAGTMGALFSRPKPEDIRLAYAEQRLEPFWQVSVRVRTVYDRNRSYTVPVGGPEVRRVTLHGQTVAVDAGAKGGPAVVVTGVEHCEEDRRVARTFDGEGALRSDLAKLLAAPKVEVPDLEAFRPEGTLVVPPVARATAVLRQVMAEAVQPVKAQVIHSERVDVEELDLCFQPRYAFEFHWLAKDKHVVVEFDGITGEARTGGKALKDKFKSMLSRELMFDVTADAVELVVPGGGIAVKLVKAAIDRARR